MKNLRTTNIIEIQEWCRKYMHHGPHPVKPVDRLAIAFYQVGQGRKWADWMNPNAWESYAASLIHLTIALENMDTDLYTHILPARTLEEVSGPYPELEEAFDGWTKATQMVFYGAQAAKKGYSRKSRFDRDELSKAAATIARHLMKQIPKQHRAEAIEWASETMVGSL